MLPAARVRSSRAAEVVAPANASVGPPGGAAPRALETSTGLDVRRRRIQGLLGMGQGLHGDVDA